MVYGTHLKCVERYALAGSSPARPMGRKFTLLPKRYNGCELGGDGFSEPWPLSDSPKSLTENATLRLGSY
jgi:hypothetical protein